MGVTVGGTVWDCGRNSTALATLKGERSPFGWNSLAEPALKPDDWSPMRGTNSRTEAMLKAEESARGIGWPASLPPARSLSCSRGEAEDDALLADMTAAELVSKLLKEIHHGHIVT